MPLRSRRTCHITAVLIASLTALATSAAAAPPASKNVQVRLVSEVESIRPGEPFRVGLLLRMAPEWHTYWVNPGDSGLPTRLAWTLPDGFQAAPIEWPVPKSFSQGPVTSYGYEGEVLLPVVITPPPSLAPGTRVTLAARADWLECREACLPGRSELTVILPVRADAPRPAAAWAASFQAARQRMPEAPEGWTFEARETPDRFVLVLRPPPGSAPLREAYFFPAKGRVLDHAAPQRLTAGTGGSYRLELTPGAAAARPLGALQGVLVTQGTTGPKAVRVDARAAGARGQKTDGGARPPSEEEE